MLNHQASFADRPLSKKELTRNEKDIATISGQRTVLINEPKFIDLAGRECGADIGDADKQTKMEGAEINKSFFSSNYPITSEEASDSVVIHRIKTPTQAMKATEKYTKLMSEDSVDCRIIMPSTEFLDVIKIIKKIVTK
ncbi:164_t:CDS:2 [Gigaspora margarita]|uniref:164_t:CDS:1 n=1 Tax=Gigaspora margarita TaxID=4874 RepID=A0ABN7VG33_GIGMA|nr:164_t:CDS:2 [Gigaspora margarita]